MQKAWFLVKTGLVAAYVIHYLIGIFVKFLPQQFTFDGLSLTWNSSWK